MDLPSEVDLRHGEIRQALRGYGLFDEVLEIACGTGTWTKELELKELKKALRVPTNPRLESRGTRDRRPACRVDLGYGIRSRILSHLRRYAARRGRADGRGARLQRYLLR